jgi:hypothetical protein
MNSYRLIVFAHVLGAMGLFVSLALERVADSRLRASSTLEQAREWSRLFGVPTVLTLPSVLVAVASGIYLATASGSWSLPWVRPAVPTIIAIAVLGGIVGPRRKRLVAALAAGAGVVSHELRSSMADPLFAASWRLRTALLAALLFEMCARPEGPAALLWLAAFALAGLGWTLPAWGRTAEPLKSSNG